MMTMKNDLRGPVPGAALPDQAVRLAGALAERGIPSLRLVSPGEDRDLPARRTDLPGLIAAEVARHGQVRLECAELDLVIEATAHGLQWSTTQASTADLLARA